MFIRTETNRKPNSSIQIYFLYLFISIKSALWQAKLLSLTDDDLFHEIVNLTAMK